MSPKTIIFLAVIALCFASCGRSFSLAERFLDEAEAKLETQPDSAFVELDSLDRGLLRAHVQNPVFEKLKKLSYLS